MGYFGRFQRATDEYFTICFDLIDSDFFLDHKEKERVLSVFMIPQIHHLTFLLCGEDSGLTHVSTEQVIYFCGYVVCMTMNLRFLLILTPSIWLLSIDSSSGTIYLMD